MDLPLEILDHILFYVNSLRVTTLASLSCQLLRVTAWNSVRVIDTPWITGSFNEADEIHEPRYWFRAFSTLVTHSKHMKRVSHIKFGTDWLYPSWDNRWSDMLLRSELFTACARHLRVLHIRDVPLVRRAALGNTLASLDSPLLEELCLHHCVIPEVGYQAIASPRFQSLKRLFINSSRIYKRGHQSAPEKFCRALLTSPWAQNLTHLSIDVPCMRGSFLRVFQEHKLTNLQYLNVPDQFESLFGIHRTWNAHDHGTDLKNKYREIFGIPLDRLCIAGSIVTNTYSILSTDGIDWFSAFRFSREVPHHVVAVGQTMPTAKELEHVPDLSSSQKVAFWKNQTWSVRYSPDFLRKFFFRGRCAHLAFYRLHGAAAMPFSRMIDPVALVAGSKELSADLNIDWSAQEPWTGNSILHGPTSGALRSNLLKHDRDIPLEQLTALVRSMNKAGRFPFEWHRWDDAFCAACVALIQFPPDTNMSRIKNFVYNVGPKTLLQILTKPDESILKKTILAEEWLVRRVLNIESSYNPCLMPALIEAVSTRFSDDPKTAAEYLERIHSFKKSSSNV